MPADFGLFAWARLLLATAIFVVLGGIAAAADTGLQPVETGLVEIVDGERRGTAARAIFLEEQGELILTGDPRLWDGRSMMEAERIVYNLRTRNMRAEGRVRGDFPGRMDR